MLAQRSILAAAIGATLASAARAAEEQPKVMKKVTVGADVESYNREESSSAKYTQPLVDTPQTVVIIPQEVIAERNATTLRDVLRNTPGITFQAGEGGGGLPGDQNFTMRGFTSRNSVFSDGVRDVGSYTRDAFNLRERRSRQRSDWKHRRPQLHRRRHQSDQQGAALRRRRMAARWAWDSMNTTRNGGHQSGVRRQHGAAREHALSRR